jgi:DNA-binding GntR family transcriptional regulator
MRKVEGADVEERPAAPVMHRSCMYKKIRDVLVTRILDGTYPPDFRLKELALAREFDVSQAPVREALRELDALGMVTSEHYRGTRVRGVDVAEMREAYELRSVIEQRAAELLVARAAEVCDVLAGFIEEMRAASAARDWSRQGTAALRFHRAMVEASGNRTFLATWDSFHWDVRAQVMIRRIGEHHGGLAQMVGPHVAILDALRSGDGAAAAAAVRRNFEIFIGLLDATQR